MLRYPGTGHTVQIDQPPAELCDVTLSNTSEPTISPSFPLITGGTADLSVPHCGQPDQPGTYCGCQFMGSGVVCGTGSPRLLSTTRMVARLERDKYQIQSRAIEIEDKQRQVGGSPDNGRAGSDDSLPWRMKSGHPSFYAIGDLPSACLMKSVTDVPSECWILFGRRPCAWRETLDTVLFYVKPSQPQKRECNLNELETLSLYFAQKNQLPRTHIDMVFETRSKSSPSPAR